MTAHSEHGASICKRWWNCPGSVSLVRGMPNDSSDAAELGTAAHELAALCLNSGQDAIDYVDRTVHGYMVDSDMAEAVQVYLDECRGPIEPGQPDTFATMRAMQPENTFIERQFDLAPFDPPAPMFGTADFACYIPVHRALYVKDYKHGIGVNVEAQDNPQLKYYALGALLALGPDKPVSTVHVAIIQPRAPGRVAIKRATYDAEYLAAWSITLMRRAAATLAPDAPCVPGDWCKATFCPAAGVCRPRADAAMAVAAAEFSGSPPADWTPPDPRLLTAEDIGGLLGRVDAVEAWIGALRAAAEAAIRRGQDVPGWKLVPTEGRQAWRDPVAATFDLQAEYGVGSEIMTAPELRSPAQVRGVLAALAVKQAAARGHKLTKKSAEEAARMALADLVHKPPGGLKLAAVTDSRAAQIAGAEFLLNPPTPE